MIVIQGLGQLDKASMDALVRRIIEMAAANVRAGYGLQPSGVATWVNTQMPRNQRLYRIELEKAADALATMGQASGFRFWHRETWLVAFNNSLGWRVVTPQPCQPGYTTEAITRECVPVREKPTYVSPEEETTEKVIDKIIAEQEPKPPAWILPVIAGAAALLLLMRR